MRTLRPLGDYVLVQVEKAAELLESIGEREDNKVGKVLAVGPGDEKPIAVAVGETVLFQAYSGTAVIWNGTLVKLLYEADVLAVVCD